MYISVPSEDEVSDYLPGRTRQCDVDISNTKKVFDRIKASSEILEQLVIHQVSDKPVSKRSN
jgi:hypothetical protein